MLKYIKTKNFVSFKEETTIDFVSNNRGSKKENVFSIGDNVLAKSKLIYGANASGKTNILKTMNVIVNVAIHSVQMGVKDVKPFLLNKENRELPSFFEVGFFVDQKEYVYNFEIQNDIIISENLFELNNGKLDFLFKRKGQEVTPAKNFKTERKKGEGKVRPDASFLAVLGQFDGKLNGKDIKSFFENVLVLAHQEIPINKTIEWIRKNTKNKQIVLSFLKCADIHIDDIDFLEVTPRFPVEFLREEIIAKMQANKHYLPIFGHKVQGHKEIEFFGTNEESGGTNRLFALLRPIIDTIVNEKILFVDEIENRLHIHILESLFKLIHSDIDKKYQFVFTTHDVSLMNLKSFKKEQIAIANKAKDGTTECYDLSQFDVRSENDVQKLYHNGAFGGIPNIIDFSILLKDIIGQDK